MKTDWLKFSYNSICPLKIIIVLQLIIFSKGQAQSNKYPSEKVFSIQEIVTLIADSPHPAFFEKFNGGISWTTNNLPWTRIIDVSNSLVC